MDGGAWWAAVHGVAGSRTLLSDFTFTFHFHALEKEMAEMLPLSATLVLCLLCQVPRAAFQGGLPAAPPVRVAERRPGLQDS